MSEAAANFSDKFEELRLKYEKGLQAVVCDLKEALEKLRAGPLSAEEMQALRLEAHKLAGSAGSFGYREMGFVARELERSFAKNGDNDRLEVTQPLLVKLIAHIESLKPGPQADGAAPEVSQQAETHRTARILIAEDHSITQDLLKLVLSRRGHSVDMVSDGEEALAALRENAYDVAFLDFHLPKMDGVRVVNSFLANNASGRKPTFVAMTADVEGLLAHSENCENFDEVAPKPVNIDQICDLVEKRKEKSAGRAPSPERSGPVAVASPIAAPPPKPASPALTFLEDLDCNFLRWPHDINEGHHTARALQASIHDGRFDAILIEECDDHDALADIWRMKFLHLLPVVDGGASLGARIETDISSMALRDTVEAAKTIEAFAARRARLHEEHLYTDNIPEKILGRLYVSNGPLTPFYKPSKGSLVEYNCLLPSHIVEQHAKRLVADGFLKPRFFDRAHVCGGCNSSLFNIREECPDCRSPNIDEESYIHHFTCAYQGPESDFRQKDDLVCPKCRRELRHFGHDYDRPGIMLKCGSCGAATSEPLVGFVCLSCGRHADGDTVSTTDIFSYELTEQAIGYLEGGSAYLGVSQQTLRYSELPLDLVIALNEEAKKFNEDKSPFALLEFSYANERTIEQEHGARQFSTLRGLFVENLRNEIGSHAKVVQGRSYDFALLRGEHADEARKSAESLCRQAARDLRMDPGAMVAVFGPEDLY